MKDIKTELKNRKYHITNKFYYWFYRTVMKIKARKYHVTYERIDDVRKYDGPCFVIFNHLSRIDHAYVVEACYPKRLNMIAGYNEFYRSHLHFAFKCNNVIPKKQYVQDISGMKAMMSVIKKGGSITFAPEGLATNDGMNKPIVPGTGAMLKKLGVPVFFCKLRGQYLQNTKVCLDIREGKTFATTSLLFSQDDLKTLTPAEIDAKINETFRNDEYKWEQEMKIKWDIKGRPCKSLDGLLYKCPRCKTNFSMHSTDDKIECSNCGNSFTVNEYYELVPLKDDSVGFKIQSDWVNWQRQEIIDDIRKDDNYSYKERVKIGRLPTDHYLKDLKTSEVVGEGYFIIDHQGVHYQDDKDSNLNFDLSYNEIYTFITEVDSSYFNFYVNNEYTDIFPLEHHSSLMVTALVEEMHRLHVNTYKNFPWFDYMYENKKMPN